MIYLERICWLLITLLLHKAQNECTQNDNHQYWLYSQISTRTIDGIFHFPPKPRVGVDGLKEITHYCELL